VSPADSFGTAIGVGIGINVGIGIGIGVGIELTNPISAKLLAERLVERYRNPEAVRCRCRNRGRYRAFGSGVYDTDNDNERRLSRNICTEALATLSALRERGHTTIEQCLLLAVVVCGQRFAHQRARPESQRTPAPSLVRFQTTGVDPRSSLCRYPRHCSARWPTMRA
jgi:hypothetical protein